MENVQYINFSFSGSSYHITRSVFEQEYPDWEKVIKGTMIDQNSFDQYIESEMNDTAFVEKAFDIFEKEGV